ncbi:unnamed protein product [Closterium sp. NIES-54]
MLLISSFSPQLSTAQLAIPVAAFPLLSSFTLSLCPFLASPFPFSPFPFSFPLPLPSPPFPSSTSQHPTSRAAAPEIPLALKQQLKEGGRMVIPVGTWSQDLLVVDKLPDGRFKESHVASVRYVPLTSKDEQLEGY